MSELLLRGGLLTRRLATSLAPTGYDARVGASTAFDDLVAWVKLDSNPPVDTRGTMNPGSIVGGVTFTESALPDASTVVADFNGSTGYVSFADNVGLHLSACAIHLAVDIDAFPASGQFRSIVTKEGAGLTDQDFVLSLFNNAGAQELRAQFILGGVVHRAIRSNMTLGRHWITLNIGNGAAAALFVDRVQAATISTYTVGINLNTRNLIIGAVNFGSGVVDFFDGRMSHLQIYDRRLTQAEIDYLSFPLFPSLSASLDFEDGNTSRHYTIPNASALNFASGVGALGLWTKVDDNLGTAFQYALSLGLSSTNPHLQIYLPEASAAEIPNALTFRIADDAGVGGGIERSSSLITGADGVERLVVVQSTGSAIQMWLCPRNGAATLVYNAPVSLGALTASSSWHLGRRSDGEATRYWEEWLGGLFKSDVALSQSQIEQIATGVTPTSVLGANCAALWRFSDGPVESEVDVVGGIVATRQGTWTSAEQGIAAQFIGDVNISSHPSVILHETFESGSFSTNGWTMFPSGVATITTTAANVHAGTRAAELTCLIKTDSGGQIEKSLSPGRSTLFVRAYIRFDPLWNLGTESLNHCGISIRAGDAVAGVRPDGTNLYNTTFQPTQQDASTTTAETYPPVGRIYNYSYHMDMPGSFGERLFDNQGVNTQTDPGVWYHWETMLKANTPGVADGEIKTWINGVLVTHYTGMRFRTISSLLIDRVRLSNYVHNNSVRVNRLWFDDVVFATEYVGPMRMS